MLKNVISLFYALFATLGLMLISSSLFGSASWGVLVAIILLIFSYCRFLAWGWVIENSWIAVAMMGGFALSLISYATILPKILRLVA